MLLRSLAVAAALACLPMAAAPQIPGKEYPDPSLIENRTAEVYRVRISHDNMLDISFGTVQFFKEDDARQEKPLAPKLNKNEAYFDVPAHSRLLMLIGGTETVPGKLYVKLKISIDKAGGPRDLFKIFFNHFQYNKMLVLKEHKEQMLDMLKSANFNLPDSIRKQLDSMPEVAIKLRKENPLVEVNPDNYQHADQGPLWVINAKPMLQKQR